MALATLYANALEKNSSLPKCHAIIIDHKIRDESSEEAKWVAEVLDKKFDMKSSIIPLEWPEHIDPNNTTNFETEARRLRYQALGLACKDKNLSSLLVAHHGDDQAETILMRMVNGRLRSGLQGMHPIQWIPECHGLHGVHHSGGLDTKRPPQRNPNIPYQVERGGIQVLRPLLRFEKDRLIATCKEHDTPWVEDKTNQDKTLTTRNAIRHIIAHHTLPPALSKRSLINISLHMQDRIESCRRHAENLFNNHCLLKLDIQTGSLIVRFPPVSTLFPNPIITDSDKTLARNIAITLLQRLAEMVSPKEHTTIGQLAIAIDNIYPALSPKTGTSSPSKTSFSVFGIWFREWDRSTPFVAPDAFLHRHENEWLLSRQPFENIESGKCAIEIPSHAADPYTTPKWHIFDGRFWIRVKNLSNEEVTIRPFTESDLAQLAKDSKTSLPGNWTQNFWSKDIYIKAALSFIKPADLRRTIPGIFRKRKGGGRDVLVALPTLGASVLGEKLGREGGWEVRYKKVDFGEHDVDEVVVPGIRRGDILGEAKRLNREAREKKIVIGRREEIEAEGARVVVPISERF
ncbi:hypothetical protein K469DRAFT_683045 [Zopfia rhizophila CBS 207.26]|uniref:tRNA(Ile)-lysidine synthetase n=1 Tax=Zopfia rhizophila CBS 207.26 TaxID=1314779 RepID=A0A6A6EGF6_9PEZI|nr:hypothetical protein K469DRAFT_683045 [Zopfia rhizophila CBS 207.26]